MICKLLVLAFVGTCLAARSADQYVDNVLHTSFVNELRTQGLNPAPLIQFAVNFGTRDVYGNQQQALFYYGNVTGLNSARRYSSCSGPKLYRGEITINCTLDFTQPIVNYYVRVSNGSSAYLTRSMGHVRGVQVRVVIAGNSQNQVGYLKIYQVAKVGDVTPTFSNYDPYFAKFLPVVNNQYRTTVTSFLYSLFQQRVYSALGRALQFVPMPRQ